MKLTDEDRARKVRLVLLCPRVTGSLLDELSLLGMGRHTKPKPRGEYYALEEDIWLGQLVDGFRRLAPWRRMCLGIAIFWYPDDGSAPVLQKVETQASIGKVLNALTSGTVKAGLDLQWGESVDDRIPQAGREVVVA